MDKRRPDVSLTRSLADGAASVGGSRADPARSRRGRDGPRDEGCRRPTSLTAAAVVATAAGIGAQETTGGACEEVRPLSTGRAPGKLRQSWPRGRNCAHTRGRPCQRRRPTPLAGCATCSPVSNMFQQKLPEDIQLIKIGTLKLNVKTY